MWYCCLKILLSKGEHCNNDLAYFTAVYSCCILLLFGSSEIPANVRNMTCVNVLYDETMNSPSSFHLHFDIWHSI